MQMTPSLHAALLNGAALGNVVSSIIVLYFMQTVTASSGIGSALALLQGVQRVLYVVLCGALAVNALHIYNAGELPGFYDGMVELALFALCAVSFMRHRLAPPVPADATWKCPPAAVEYGPRPPRTPNGKYSNGQAEVHSAADQYHEISAGR